MNLWKKLLLLAGPALLVGFSWMETGAADESDNTAPFTALKISKEAQLGADLSQMSRAIPRLASQDWKPKVNTDKARGPSAKVYPQVAPAVVVVRTDIGHGTGFVISPDGWILTNNHVIADANMAPDTGALVANIYMGQLEDDMMRLSDQVLTAQVYKHSEAKDLALLKLDIMPAGAKTVPTVRLADKAPAPGADCVVLGHPASGMLWTVRSGEITSSGDYPHDMISAVMSSLAAQGKQRDALKQALARTPKRKVIVSSCGISFGDSGGPLVNPKGELIAVTFAIPSAEKRGASTLSYHVHLDEVKAFIADRPEQAPVHIPSPWPMGEYSEVKDLDGDGTPDTLVFALRPGQGITGLLMDLSQTSRSKFSKEQLANPGLNHAWNFEFAWHLLPQQRAFYDTDGDGKIDLILIDTKKEGKADLVLRLKGDKWVKEDGKGQALVDPTLFKNEKVRDRFIAILRKLVAAK